MSKAIKKDNKDLDQILADIERQFGKGAVMCLGEDTHMKIDVVSSGCLSLDIALGVGGYPKGRIIEIYGPESSGKTTFALQAIAEVQKLGGRAAFIDAEHALDPDYARRLGVKTNELLLSQPDTGEQALEICEALVRSEAISIIVIDSVAALVPQAEIDGEMGDSHVGLQARLMSQALRKLSGTINKTNTIAIFINQLREKVGVMFGNPETTPGGRALKFYDDLINDNEKGKEDNISKRINMLAMCNAGSQILSINASGKVTLCSAMEESNVILGDIDELDIIFHDVKRINTICVVDTVTPCNECDVRYFCSSMCHAVNTNIYNNNQLKEKRCEQYKNLLEKHVWGI